MGKKQMPSHSKGIYLWLKASRDLTETVLLGIHFWDWDFIGQVMVCSLIFWKTDFLKKGYYPVHR